MNLLKRLVLPLFAVILFSSGISSRNVAYYQVIPLPQEIVQTEQTAFTLNKKTRIVYTPGNEMLKKNAEFLAEYIQSAVGLKLKVQAGNGNAHSIILSTGLDKQNKEAYTITVSKEEGVKINGASEAGTFYGVQTIRKSLPEHACASVLFPAVTINDQPRFGYRGMMLDVCRHFMTVDEVKRFIDMMVLHNQNIFHWHLTEDQGWRIEIKKYPRLTEIGSMRKETVVGHKNESFDGIPHIGFYTQKQILDVLDYAKQRYITIIPEIDMPGHMVAAMTAYPYLGCTGGPYEVRTSWGVAKDVLCIGKVSTFEFIEDVLTEVLELFPSQFIHIGGDEAPRDRWAACPQCQARIKAEGLEAKDGHSAEDRLQSYFTTRVEKFLNAHGRRLIGWGEILEGGLAPDATVMSWKGVTAGIKAAQQNHDVVMSPNSHAYFDRYQTKDTENEPDAFGGFVPVDVVYSFEPLAKELTAEQHKHILGVQANVWTEYIPNFKQVEYMSLPRMAAISEVMWTNPERKNYQKFLTRLPRLIDIYEALDYKYATHIFDVPTKAPAKK